MLGMRSKYTVNAFPPFLAIQPSFFLPPPRFLFPSTRVHVNFGPPLFCANENSFFPSPSLPSPSFYVSFYELSLFLSLLWHPWNSNLELNQADTRTPETRCPNEIAGREGVVPRR